MSDSPDDQMKPCRMCRQPMAVEARKCPFCRHWQGRFAAFLHGPLAFVLFIVVLMGVLMVVVSRLQTSVNDAFSGKGQPFCEYADRVTVIESAIRFGQDEHGALVAVVGKIKNESPLDWKEAHLQVCFYDPNGALIDAGQEEKCRSPFLPAGQEVGFSISFPRAYPESQYARQMVRVISAKDGSVRF
jgi:hypothetical protein